MRLREAPLPPAHRLTLTRKLIWAVVHGAHNATSAFGHLPRPPWSLYTYWVEARKQGSQVRTHALHPHPQGPAPATARKLIWDMPHQFTCHINSRVLAPNHQIEPQSTRSIVTPLTLARKLAGSISQNPVSTHHGATREQAR